MTTPEQYNTAKQKKAPLHKAMYLCDLDKARMRPRHEVTAKPLAETCIVIDKLASALVHHNDNADFYLASNTGNTTIMLCRLIVMACASYVDWVGWSGVADAHSLVERQVRLDGD